VIDVPLNTSGVDRTQTIIVTAYSSSREIISTKQIILIQSGVEGYLLNESGGNLLQENLDKIEL